MNEDTVENRICRAKRDLKIGKDEMKMKEPATYAM